jgi:hypothetical protein
LPAQLASAGQHSLALHTLPVAQQDFPHMFSSLQSSTQSPFSSLHLLPPLQNPQSIEPFLQPVIVPHRSVQSHPSSQGKKPPSGPLGCGFSQV